ncbi:transcription and mRNA export factor ENY2-like isoform X2 [Amblyomma americanum]
MCGHRRSTLAYFAYWLFSGMGCASTALLVVRSCRSAPRPFYSVVAFTTAVCAPLFSLPLLKELLHTRLTECGWKDQLKAYCKEIIREKGVENISIEELIAAVTPIARATVPDIIKRELVHEIKNFLDQQACG